MDADVRELETLAGLHAPRWSSTADGWADTRRPGCNVIGSEMRRAWLRDCSSMGISGRWFAGTHGGSIPSGGAAAPHVRPGLRSLRSPAAAGATDRPLPGGASGAGEGSPLAPQAGARACDAGTPNRLRRVPLRRAGRAPRLRRFQSDAGPRRGPRRIHERPGSRLGDPTAYALTPWAYVLVRIMVSPRARRNPARQEPRPPGGAHIDHSSTTSATRRAGARRVAGRSRTFAAARRACPGRRCGRGP